MLGSNICTTSSAYIWHLRLGHPNIDAIRIALQLCYVTFLRKVLSVFVDIHREDSKNVPQSLYFQFGSQECIICL